MTDLSKIDYKNICETQKKEIELLKSQLDNFESIQRSKCCDCEKEAIQDYADLMIKIDCFDDDFFKGLSYKEIAELAKKSIRLTEDNNNLRHKLEDIAEIVGVELYGN